MVFCNFRIFFILGYEFKTVRLPVGAGKMFVVLIMVLLSLKSSNQISMLDNSLKESRENVKITIVNGNNVLDRSQICRTLSQQPFLSRRHFIVNYIAHKTFLNPFFTKILYFKNTRNVTNL